MSAGQRVRQRAWQAVTVNFASPVGGLSEREDAVRAVLRRSFRDGPSAAANAQAAYKSWVHGAVELGGSKLMPPAARRWSQFLDQWAEYDSLSVGRFAEIDGIDFGEVQKAKPKIRMRM